MVSREPHSPFHLATVLTEPAGLPLAASSDLAQSGGFAVFGAILGAILSVALAYYLDVSGKLDEARERRRKQKATRTREEKEKEAREAEEAGHPFFADWPPSRRSEEEDPRDTRTVEPWRPGPEDLPPKGDSLLVQALAAFREFVTLSARWLKDLLSLTLMMPWIVVCYLLTASGIFWLDSVVRSLGFSEGVVTAVLATDAVLTAVTGAWIVTGIRTRKRALPARVAQTAMLVGLFVGSAVLETGSGNVILAGAFLLAGVWLYIRLFP